MATQYYCNICGKPIKSDDDAVEIYDLIGYGSKYDGEWIEMDICYDCLDKIIDACKISPVIPLAADGGID